MASHYWRDDPKDFWSAIGTLWIGSDADEVRRAKAKLAAQLDGEGEDPARCAALSRLDPHHLCISAPAKARPSVFDRSLVRCPAMEGPEGWDTPNGLYLTTWPASLLGDMPTPLGVIEAAMGLDMISGKVLICADMGVLRGLIEGPQSLDDEENDGKGVLGQDKEGENTMIWRAREGRRWVPSMYHFV